MNIALISVTSAGMVTLAVCLFVFALPKQKSLFNRVVVSSPAFEYRRRQFTSQRVRYRVNKPDASIDRQVELELPAILEIVIANISAGESLFASIDSTVSRASGRVAKEFRAMVLALQLGSDFESELNALSKRLPSPQILEMCNKAALSMNRGSPLASMLRQQVQSCRAALRNQMLKQAGVNETRMLIPLVFMVLPITVLFAVYPSLQLLQFSNQ